MFISIISLYSALVCLHSYTLAEPEVGLKGTSWLSSGSQATPGGRVEGAAPATPVGGGEMLGTMAFTGDVQTHKAQ